MDEEIGRTPSLKGFRTELMNGNKAALLFRYIFS